MPIDVRDFILISWMLWLLIWAAWSGGAKRTIRRQTRSSRILQTAVVAVSIWLLVSDVTNRGTFAVVLWNHSPVTDVIALLLDVSGLALTFWARAHLGGNWSSTVTVKHGHELISSGPYRVVRHPIYSGLSLSALGLAIWNGDLRSLGAVGIMLLGWRLKSKVEEQFMTDQFGPQYLEYMRRVKALIPYVW